MSEKKRRTVLTTKPMTLTGLVKTSKGYAIATSEVSTTGEMLSLKVGPSQAYPQFVAVEHKRLLRQLSTLLLTGRPV